MHRKQQWQKYHLVEARVLLIIPAELVAEWAVLKAERKVAASAALLVATMAVWKVDYWVDELVVLSVGWLVLVRVVWKVASMAV